MGEKPYLQRSQRFTLFSYYTLTYRYEWKIKDT